MRLRQFLATACALALPLQSGFAVTQADIDQAVSQIQADSTLISGWMSDQLKFVIPFNATAGNAVPSQLKIFGFEVGVEGGATSTKLDVPGLRNLGTTIVDPNRIDTFSRMPWPAVLLHAKVGLPFGLDAGFRAGGIPSTSLDKDTTHIKVKSNI